MLKEVSSLEKFKAVLEGMLDAGAEDTEHMQFSDNFPETEHLKGGHGTVRVKYICRYGFSQDLIVTPQGHTQEDWYQLGLLIPDILNQRRAQGERWRREGAAKYGRPAPEDLLQTIATVLQE